MTIDGYYLTFDKEDWKWRVVPYHNSPAFSVYVFSIKVYNRVGKSAYRKAHQKCNALNNELQTTES